MRKRRKGKQAKRAFNKRVKRSKKANRKIQNYGTSRGGIRL